jgi:hypothetical protein
VQAVEGGAKDYEERGVGEVEAVMFRVIKGFCLGTVAAGIQKFLEPFGGNKMPP